MTRKKSINDINAQLDRINAELTRRSEERSHTGRGEWCELLDRELGWSLRATSKHNEYISNIEKTKWGATMLNKVKAAYLKSGLNPTNSEYVKISEKFRSRKFSRRTYMGLSRLKKGGEL